jgi:hypothetical protein
MQEDNLDLDKKVVYIKLLYKRSLRVVYKLLLILMT